MDKDRVSKGFNTKNKREAFSDIIISDIKKMMIDFNISSDLLKFIYTFDVSKSDYVEEIEPLHGLFFLSVDKSVSKNFLFKLECKGWRKLSKNGANYCREELEFSIDSTIFVFIEYGYEFTKNEYLRLFAN